MLHPKRKIEVLILAGLCLLWEQHWTQVLSILHPPTPLLKTPQLMRSSQLMQCPDEKEPRGVAIPIFRLTFLPIGLWSQSNRVLPARVPLMVIMPCFDISCKFPVSNLTLFFLLYSSISAAVPPRGTSYHSCGYIRSIWYCPSFILLMKHFTQLSDIYLTIFSSFFFSF